MLKSNSIDPNEVAYYTKLADSWWDESGPFWPLHALNRLRIQWIIKQLQQLGIADNKDKPLLGLTVLDIGCGGGILSESLANAGAVVTAIDVVEKNIQIAKLHAEQENLNIDYRYQTAEDLAASGAKFDIVFNMEVVEHVADVNNFMADSCALVKTNGFQFVATINRNWLAYIVAIFGAETVLGLLPKGTHQYRKLCKPAEIKTCLQSGGMEIVKRCGISVNPFTKKMKTHPFTSVNYMLLAKKFALLD